MCSLLFWLRAAGRFADRGKHRSQISSSLQPPRRSRPVKSTNIPQTQREAAASPQPITMTDFGRFTGTRLAGQSGGVAAPNVCFTSSPPECSLQVGVRCTLQQSHLGSGGSTLMPAGNFNDGSTGAGAQRGRGEAVAATRDGSSIKWEFTGWRGGGGMGQLGDVAASLRRSGSSPSSRCCRIPITLPSAALSLRPSPRCLPAPRAWPPFPK